MDDFVSCFHAENRYERAGTRSSQNKTGRWRSFTYDEPMARDKANLDILWLRDEPLEDSANLPDSSPLATKGLRAALAQFSSIASELGDQDTEPTHTSEA